MIEPYQCVIVINIVTGLIVDVVHTHGGCYLGMLKETNHAIQKLSKAYIYFILNYINNVYDRNQKLLIIL